MIKPGIFYIETFLGCNLQCPECPMGNRSINRKNECMTLEQFKTLADKIEPYAKVVYPFIWGEPTLNPYLPEMIEYVKGFARVNISTNANAINEDLAKRIMEAKPDIIDVPLDAATEETYQIVRKGGNLKKAIQAIKDLQQYNISTTIRGQFVVFKQNSHEIKDFKELCVLLNIPTRINKALIFNKNLEPDPQWVRPTCVSFEHIRQNTRSCESRIRMVILINGDVVPCCFDYNSTIVFGNLFKQSVKEIWESPVYVGFRNKLNNKKSVPPDFCLKSCPRFIIHPKLQESMDKIRNK